MAQIIVNGEMKNWSNPTINYSEVSLLAYPTQRGQYTVTYSRAKGEPSRGSLAFDSTETVNVQNGTNFNVVMTNNA